MVSEHPAEPDGTQRITVGTPDAAEATSRLRLPGDTVPSRQMRLDAPAQADGQTLRPPAPGVPQARGFGWKLPLALGLLVVAAAAGYMTWRGSARPAPSAVPLAPAAETPPPGALVYYEQAQAGDAHAMRMLGVMYYYGLNVPQDREKGLHWYRKAAEKGSDAARAELAKLQGNTP